MVEGKFGGGESVLSALAAGTWKTGDHSKTLRAAAPADAARNLRRENPALPDPPAWAVSLRCWFSMLSPQPTRHVCVPSQV